MTNKLSSGALSVIATAGGLLVVLILGIVVINNLIPRGRLNEIKNQERRVTESRMDEKMKAQSGALYYIGKLDQTEKELNSLAKSNPSPSRRLVRRIRKKINRARRLWRRTSHATGRRWIRLYQRANKAQEDVERLMMELRESLGIDTEGQPLKLPLDVEVSFFEGEVGFT